MLAATRYQRRTGLGQINPTITVPPEVATAIDKLTAAANTLVSTVSNFQIRVEHDVKLPPTTDIIERVLPTAILVAAFMTGTVILTKKVLASNPEPAYARAR